MITALKLWLIFNAFAFLIVFRVRGVPIMRKVYHTPLGLSTVKPDVEITPIDRVLVATRAHKIAAAARPRSPDYRSALSYGFRAAWEQGKVAQSFAMLRAQVKPREHSASDIEASRAATRRVGSSFT